MSSIVQRAQQIRARLMNPPNAIPDQKPEPSEKASPFSHAGELERECVRVLEEIRTLDKRRETLWRRYRLLNNLEPPRPSIGLIQNTVADYYKVDLGEMLSGRRQACIVRPRQVAMYLAKKLTLKSLPFIGTMFNNRDHTTVLHAVNKMEMLRQGDEKFAAQIKEIEQLVASKNKIEDATCSSQQNPTSTAQ